MATQFFPVLPLFPQPMPVQKIQQHWLDGFGNLVSLELEAFMEYNHLWLSLWQDCAAGDQKVCHERLVDHWAEHQKLIVSHQKRREAVFTEWKEHIEEVL